MRVASCLAIAVMLPPVALAEAKKLSPRRTVGKHDYIGAPNGLLLGRLVCGGTSRIIEIFTGGFRKEVGVMIMHPSPSDPPRTTYSVAVVHGYSDIDIWGYFGKTLRYRITRWHLDPLKLGSLSLSAAISSVKYPARNNLMWLGQAKNSASDRSPKCSAVRLAPIEYGMQRFDDDKSEKSAEWFAERVSERLNREAIKPRRNHMLRLIQEVVPLLPDELKGRSMNALEAKEYLAKERAKRRN